MMPRYPYRGLFQLLASKVHNHIKGLLDHIKENANFAAHKVWQMCSKSIHQMFITTSKDYLTISKSRSVCVAHKVQKFLDSWNMPACITIVPLLTTSKGQFNHIRGQEICACYNPACPVLPLPACLHIQGALPSNQLTLSCVVAMTLLIS